MTTQTFTRVAEGIVQRAPKQYLARTWRGGPSQTFATKADAVAWRRQQYAKRDQGAPVIVRKSVETVEAECTRWLAANQSYVTAESMRIYATRIRRQVLHAKVGLGAVVASDLTYEDVEAWAGALQAQGFSARTVNQARGVLGRVLDGAVKATPPRLASNPVTYARTLPLPRQTTVEAPDASAVFAIVDALPERFQIVAWLALGAGLRFAEAVAVKPEDVHRDGLVLHVQRQWDGRQFKLPKGRKARWVPVEPSLIAKLDAHQARFGLSVGGTYASLACGSLLANSGKQWQREWDRARAATGVDLEGVHQLRHAFGSFHAAAGETVANVASWMGHASTATTHAYYFHAMPNARPSTDLLARPARSRTNRALKVVS